MKHREKRPTLRELRSSVIDAALRLADVALDAGAWQDPAMDLLDAANKLKERNARKNTRK